MTAGKLFTAVLVAWLIAAAGLVWMMIAGGMGPEHLFSQLSIVSVLAVFFAIISTVLSVIGALVGVRVLGLIGAGAAVGWGVFGAAWSEMLVAMTLSDVGPMPLAIVAPSHAGTFTALLIGLTGALIGLGILRLRAPRA